MKVLKLLGGLGAAGALAVAAGCHSLDVTNPNAPSSKVLTDPGVLEAVAGGTMRNWFNNYLTLEVAGVLDVQAQTLASSWNNGNINSYQHINIAPSDTVTQPATWTRPNGWYNDLASPQRTSVEHWWYGFYATMSAANDALHAIRVDKVAIGDAARTKRAEAVAQLMQGAALMMIANDYDQGYFLDENTTPEQLAALTRVSRKVLRDSAEAKLKAAAAIASATPFNTDPGWANGVAYSNTEIAQIANTLAAYSLAFYARDDAEAASAVNWSKVADYASKGISSGTPTTFQFVGDGCGSWCNDMSYWFTEYSTGRTHTRVAHFMDPATQIDPYVLGVGSPQPNSPDKRMGDGTFGDASIQDVYQNIPKDAGAGTYFAWSGVGEIFRPDRGFYAQSNIGFIRYDDSGNMSLNANPGGFGNMAVILPSTNDLLWAEALLRKGSATDLPKVVSLINNTRVGAGGLPPASIADPVGSPADGDCMATGVLAKDGTACTLWSKLLYEQDIEYLELGPVGFWHQRELPLVKATAWEQATGCRKPATGCAVNANTIYNGARYIQGLLPGTPREMPVPAKELALHAESFYSFGGVNPTKGAEAP
ncbi:MAG TPA: hypothetical protein VF159_04565 [Gemmatimonadaceae bacterium]